MFKKQPVVITADDFKYKKPITTKSNKNTATTATIISKEQFLASKNVIIDEVVEKNTEITKTKPVPTKVSGTTVKYAASSTSSRADDILWIQ